MLMKLSGLE